MTYYIVRTEYKDGLINHQTHASQDDALDTAVEEGYDQNVITIRLFKSDIDPRTEDYTTRLENLFIDLQD